MGLVIVRANPNLLLVILSLFFFLYYNEARLRHRLPEDLVGVLSGLQSSKKASKNRRITARGGDDRWCGGSNGKWQAC